MPGWSVSADALKTQGDPGPHTLKDVNPNEGKEKPSTKRKRGSEHSNGIQITGDNLAELWEKHIEGKSQRKINGRIGGEDDPQEGRKKKKSRKRAMSMGQTESPIGQAVPTDTKDEQRTSPIQQSKDIMAEEPGNEVAKTRGTKESGKAEYEARMKKKQEKIWLRASGGLPPSRPATTSEPSPNQNSKATSEPTNSASLLVEKRKNNTMSRLPINMLAKKLSIHSTILDDPTQDEPKEQKSRSPQAPAPPKSKPKSKSKLKAHAQDQASSDDSNKSPKVPTLPTTLLPLPPEPSKTLTPNSKLTPLQSKMQSKLLSARFRHLNQTLYTTPSSQASALFTSTPSAYTSYHAGFRAQVSVWPQNPVETFIADIKSRGGLRREVLGAQKNAWRQEKRGKSRKGGKPSDAIGGNKDIEALPRTSGLCTIADLGCGDAMLAGVLQPSAGPKDLHLKLHSFDLSKGDGPHASLVTVADITKLPLEAGKVDVAVLCLSLMGTNWVSCVDEVSRVVRWGGEAWVAEIKSRFARVGKKGEGGIGKVKGDIEKGGKQRKKGSGEGDHDDDEKEPIGDVVEIDSDPDILTFGRGAKDKKRLEDETDVSAFVEVWRRRGFEIKGEVDLGNKMFVRMRFVKRETLEENWPSAGRDQMKEKIRQKTKFIDEDTDVDMGNEAKVLKPCVYKLR